MFQGFSNLAGLMKNAQQLQGRAEEMRQRLAQQKSEGTAGGGMVKAVVTGDQKLVSVAIEPTLVTSGDQEMIEDLVVAAVNQALDNARTAAAEEMASLAEGMGIPGLQDALTRFGLGN